jgi:hypothetical protein
MCWRSRVRNSSGKSAAQQGLTVEARSGAQMKWGICEGEMNAQQKMSGPHG